MISHHTTTTALLTILLLLAPSTLAQTTTTTPLPTSQNPSDTSTTTVSLLFGAPQFAGSILSADSTATTYILECAPQSSASGACTLLNLPVPPSLTVFQGPSTAGASATLPDLRLTVNIGCSLVSGSLPVDCTITATTGILSFETPTDIAGLGKGLDPVRITAGLEKLAAASESAANGNGGGNGNGGSDGGLGVGEMARWAALVGGLVGAGAVVLLA